MKWLGVEGAVVGDEIVPGDVGIEDGKIVHSRTFYNEADALRQLGYSLVPPDK